MDLKLIASFLLALRLFSTLFLVLVLKRQITLIKDTVTNKDATRKLLLFIVLITLLGNAIPIIIDIVTIFGESNRQPTPLGVAYAFSGAGTALMSALGWWFLYKLIQQEQQQMETDNQQLTSDNRDLTAENKTQKQENKDLTAENKELREDK